MNIFHLKTRFFIFFIFCLIVMTGLHLLNENAQQEPLFVFSEIQTASVNFQKGISNLVKKYAFLLTLREKNQRLEIQNRKLTAHQQIFDEILTENERLKKLIQFPLHPHFDFLPAQVTGTDFLSKNTLLMINKGSRHGVKKFMGVVHPSGVVGYIFRVSLNSAQVITLLNPLSSLPARTQTSRITGLISANKKNLLRFDYLDRNFTTDKNKAKLQAESNIVTIKSNQFPAGFLVGDIVSMTHSAKYLEPEIYVQPAVKFYSLEEVLVIIDHPIPLTKLKLKTNEN